MDAVAKPQTLQQAIVYFSDPDRCLAEMIRLRWQNGPVACPTCGGTKVSYLKTRRVWECAEKHAKRQFSAKVGTIMEDSAIGLDKWLTAMWLIANAKNGISSYELARAIGVTQKSAWFMLHRIRLAMHDDPNDTLSGHVEADETFIGGKARNMHAGRKARVLRGPRWTPRNRPSIDRAKPATTDGRPRRSRSTARQPPDASRCSPSSASCGART